MSVFCLILLRGRIVNQRSRGEGWRERSRGDENKVEEEDKDSNENNQLKENNLAAKESEYENDLKRLFESHSTILLNINPLLANKYNFSNFIYIKKWFR